MKVKKIFIVTTLFAAFLFTANQLFAQQSSQGLFDLTVSPVFFDYTANPGDTISSRIRVRNNTSSDINLVVQLKKLGPDPNLGELTLLDPGTDPTQYWFHFPATKLLARSREWTDVPFTISVPKDAAFGYYYAVTLSQTNNGIIGKNGAALTGSSAIPILLVVKTPGALAKASLVNFQTNKALYESTPVYFSTTIKNTGNIHVRAHGNIFIRGTGANNLAVLDVNAGGAALIPGVKQTYQTDWNDGFMTGQPIEVNGTDELGPDGLPQTQLKINWNQLTSLRIGKYTADLLLVYDDGTRDQTIESETTFWILPWKFIAGVVIAIIILIVAIRFLLKWYIDREIKKRRK